MLYLLFLVLSRVSWLLRFTVLQVDSAKIRFLLDALATPFNRRRRESW